MIKSLKLSALALVVSFGIFQAQADNHSEGFDCNRCNSKANSSDIAFLKSCGDCPGLAIGGIGNDVFHREKCGTMKGDNFTPACKQASKMLAKNLFAILEIAKMDAPGNPKVAKAQKKAKSVVANLKALDKMNLGGKKGSSAPADCNVCTSKGNVRDVAFLKGCGDCPGLESWDSGAGAFLKNNCKASSGKHFSAQCRHAAKMLSKAMYSLFTLAKTGKIPGATADSAVMAKAKRIAISATNTIKNIEHMGLGEVGAVKHVSKHKAAPVADEEAPVEEKVAPVADEAPAPAIEAQ